MRDDVISASYARSFARCGQRVTVQRINGQAPTTALVSATVMAIVQGYTPDTEAVSRSGYSAKEAGAITQGDRQVMVLEQDLRMQRFPLPVQKNDKIILLSGEALNVEDVDSYKRHLAGAIEIRASGVA